MSELKQKVNLIVFISAKLGRRVSPKKAVKLAEHFSYSDIGRLVEIIRKGEVRV